jgi:hypothetical protein
MSIAPNRRPTFIAPSGVKRRTQAEPFTLDIALLRSAGFFAQRQAINISPLRGEGDNTAVLHFKLEFAIFFSSLS